MYKNCTDHEHINQLVSWYSKKFIQKSSEEKPDENRVALSYHIIRAYFSHCKNCNKCKNCIYDCQGIYKSYITVTESHNIRGPCLPYPL